MSGPSGRIVVVCGLAGAGKTTLARRLEIERAGVRFCPDDWLSALGLDLWDGAARDRIERIQLDVARRIAQTGGTAIVEWGTWTRADRDRVREAARDVGAGVELHLVDADDDELFERIRSRDRERRVGSRPITRADVADFRAMFEPPDADEWALFDPPL